jgi:hypothetical protein
MIQKNYFLLPEIWHIAPIHVGQETQFSGCAKNGFKHENNQFSPCAN